MVETKAREELEIEKHLETWWAIKRSQRMEGEKRNKRK